MQMEGQVIQVNLDDIIPNRFQPRIAFDEKALNELAASIKEHGIIQPLVLRKLGKKYEIIAGERRYKAATLAGLQTVPAVISNIDDNKSAEVALVENIQRKDLTPIEEARSYKNLLDKGYLTQEQLAKKMGLSQSAVSNKLRLLNLDNRVQQALLENKISERHARSLLSLSSGEEQRKWLDKIIKERLTVKQLDELLKKENNDDEAGGDVPLVTNPNLEQIKEQATDINNNQQKNIANMLISEDTMTEYSDNLPNEGNNVISTDNSMNNQKSDEMNTVSPFNEIVNNNQEVLNDVPPVSNKFFNQLEDEPASLDNLNPFAPNANFTIDQNNSTDNEVEVFDMPSNDVLTSPIIENTNKVNQPINMANEEDVAISTMDELNPNNKFFQPIQEESISNPDVDIPTNQSPVNPMDFVNNISMDQNQNVNTSLSLKDAINEVRSMVDQLNNKGFSVMIDEADLDASYQMNITIAK